MRAFNHIRGFRCPALPVGLRSVLESKDVSGHEHDPHSGEFTGSGGGFHAGHEAEKLKGIKDEAISSMQQIVKDHGNAYTGTKRGGQMVDKLLAKGKEHGEKIKKHFDELAG